jgi:histone deacetylase 1/2
MRNGGGNQSSANLATKGKSGGGNNQRGGRGGGGRNAGGRGNRGGFGRGGSGRGSSFEPGVYYQICGKEGHPAHRCFKWFDSNFSGPPPKSVSTATTSYGVDTNWYMDTGATDHITGDLERLSFRDKYNGGEQVHVANGSGMDIMHIGHSTLCSPSTNLRLNNILHVPKAKKESVICSSFYKG